MKNKFSTTVLLIVFLFITTLLVPLLNKPVYAAADYGGSNYPWDKPGSVDLGHSTWGYETCLPGLECSKTETLPLDPKPYYYRDQNGYDIKNCTSYVAWRAKNALGNNLNINNLSTATLWDNNLRDRKFKVKAADQVPEIGDFAQDEGDDNDRVNKPGHVGYVEDVYKDGSGKYFIVVSEYNKHNHGEYTVNTYSRDVDNKFWRKTDSEPKDNKWDNFIDVNGPLPPPVIKPNLPAIPTSASIQSALPKLNLQSPVVVLQGFKPKITVPKLQWNNKKKR